MTMPNPPSCTLEPYRTQLLRQRHRGLVCIEGTNSDCYAWLERQHPDGYMLISDHETGGSAGRIPPARFQDYLGQEFHCLVWDTFSGIHPNAIAALSGTLRAGGLLVMLLPEKRQWPHFQNQDNRRICRYNESPAQTHHYFLQRVLRALEQFGGRQCFPANTAPALAPAHAPDACVYAGQIHPTPDQVQVSQDLLAHLNTYPKQPRILTADRGRGKSATLGMLAAQYAQQRTGKICITAPRRASTQTLVEAYRQMGGNMERLVFHPPDYLLRDPIDCAVLLIDEAAAITVPVLEALVTGYAGVVMTTTMHGYEGSGRGFEIRFGHALNARYPNCLRRTLTAPIRWAVGDPLEQMINGLFCLDAQLPGLRPPEGDIRFTLHYPHDLAENNLLLNQAMALLVNAHYQTRPDDLRLMMDHPDAMIMACHSGDQLIGAALVMREGGIKDADVAAGIIAGKRRPRGQLVPQMLAHASADPRWLAWQSWRVVRIAVHPECQDRGLGSALLDAISSAARARKVDLVSSSFGAHTRLLRFWTRRSFLPMHLGYHLDGASNAYALIVILPLQSATRQACQIQQQALASQLQHARHLHPHLSGHTASELSASLPADYGPISPHFHEQLRLAACEKRSLADSSALLFHVLQTPAGVAAMQELTPLQQALLHASFIAGEQTSRLISAFGMTGKKELEIMQRQALAGWLQYFRGAS